MHRRTATKVKDGRVQKKNNWAPNPGDYWAVPPDEIVFDRVRPRNGHRHIVTKAQILEVLHRLPDWDEVAIGLRAIVLDNDTTCNGWYDDGVVALCNWPHDLWEGFSPNWVAEHRHILDLLGVDIIEGEEVRWTEEQARAFLLVHVLPHELGHHHDLMTTRNQSVARGEPYAEAYANRALEVLWPL